MLPNKIEQLQSCFDDQEVEECDVRSQFELKVEVAKKINEYMPANELRTARRPDKMAPRTFFLDRPFYLLRQSLNKPCLQQPVTVQQDRLKPPLTNTKNLGIEQYYNRKKFRCVYNKLQGQRLDCRTFLGKLKGIDVLIDYNWKFFKQLEQQVGVLQENRQNRIDSDFESGNLCRAYVHVEEEEREYSLLVENDVNTHGYNNWFFFRYRNKQAGVRRLNVVNLAKKTNFFAQGMLVSIFSVRSGSGWVKGGDRITFGSVNLLRDRQQINCYYSLSFQYNFHHANDEVYFALNQPYTYSRLVNFISNIQEHHAEQVQIKTISYSNSNNIIPLLRFGKAPQQSEKPIILILARQHPCETVGSFIAEYLMKELLQRSPVSDWLQEQFEFIILPMVNPDGVIHGMSRCNMSGLDLNRQWGDNALKELTPETYKIQQFIMTLSKDRKIKYMVDLHGHGKKLNSFFFCCKGSDKEKENYRFISMAMRKLQKRFDIYGCTYGISRDKESTIRSKLHNMGIKNSLTLQTSLYGWKDTNNQIKHFNESDYHQIAKSLLESIFAIEADSAMTANTLGLSKESMATELSTMIEQIEKEEKKNCQNEQVMSDSDPDGDRLDLKELLGKCSNKLIKKKIQQSFNPKPKNRRTKAFTSLQTCRDSMRLMQQTCINSTADGKATPQISSIQQSFLQSRDKLDPKQIIKHKKRSTNNNANVPAKKEFNNTQRSNQRAKNIEHNMTRRKKFINSSNIKTEVNYIVKKPNVVSQGPVSKTVIKSLKVIDSLKRRQMRESQYLEKELINTQKSEEEEPQFDLRKSQLQLRFKELKEDSLNILLTNTLSILKVIPNDKDKNHHVKQSFKNSMKNATLLPRNFLNSQSNRRIKTEMTEETLLSESMDPDSRFKKLKNLSNKGVLPKKSTKQTNSVFYYFPVI